MRVLALPADLPAGPQVGAVLEPGQVPLACAGIAIFPGDDLRQCLSQQARYGSPALQGNALDFVKQFLRQRQGDILCLRGQQV
jgi:hypothetical protein